MNLLRVWTLLILSKTVLEGSLKKIKDDYRKKNIYIRGDVDINLLRNVKGVLDVLEYKQRILVKVRDDSCIDDVFKVVKKGKNILEFVVESPSLNEIFLSKVGEVYEE